MAIAALTSNDCGGQPQIGPDKDVFKGVDALYTAVSLRDPKLLAQCEANLKSLSDADKVPSKASKALDAIIDEAKKGSWESAQSHLASFMEGQKP